LIPIRERQVVKFFGVKLEKKSEDKPSIAMTAVDGSQDVCRLDQVPGRVAVEMTALN
jgi:hypothetical protein